jgi:uncharacterized lipoprotein YbaY
VGAVQVVHASAQTWKAESCAASQASLQGCELSHLFVHFAWLFFAALEQALAASAQETGTVQTAEVLALPPVRVTVVDVVVVLVVALVEAVAVPPPPCAA